ncbi:MAG: hypothetical protein ACQEP6_02510 [Patescibacteria group bacterium]
MALKNHFLKEFSKNTKEIISSPYPCPKRDWLFILSFFFIVLFMTAVFNSSVFFYYEYFYESLDEEVNEPSAYEESVVEQEDLNLNKEELNKVWGFFDDKEERFDTVKSDWKAESPLQKNVYPEEGEGSEGTEEEDNESVPDEELEAEEMEEKEINGVLNEEETFEL